MQKQNEIAIIVEEVIKHLPTRHNQKKHAGEEGWVGEKPKTKGKRASEEYLKIMGDKGLAPYHITDWSRKKTKFSIEVMYEKEDVAENARKASEELGFDVGTKVITVGDDKNRFYSFMAYSPNYYTPRGPLARNEVRRIYGK